MISGAIRGYNLKSISLDAVETKEIINRPLTGTREEIFRDHPQPY